jgi:hypothetical protein
MQQRRHLVPVAQVVHGLEELGEYHDVVQRHGHPAACKRVLHVPRIAKEDDTFLAVPAALLRGRQEGVGHPSQTGFFEGGLDGEVEGGGELGDDFC